jgi:putative SOS response-associated peptidase YedK
VCGRFTLTTPGEIVAEAFGLEEAPSLAPRYNIAPTQPVATVRAQGATRELAMLRWGLVPVWSREPRGRTLLINARADSIGARPSFREAFERRRCLIPADGFYEWKAVAGARRKEPHLIRMADGKPFAFAGIWEPAHPGDPGGTGTCAIVTTEPSPLLRKIHDRMPVILPPAEYAAWLETDPRDASRLKALLGPCAAAMTVVRVGLAVNSAANDSPDCLRPEGPAEDSL